MARQQLTFRNLPKAAFTDRLTRALEDMDVIKAEINEAIAEIMETASPGIMEDKKAVHSYKLDFATGERELKVALASKAKPKAKPQQASLADFLEAMQANGHRA